MTQKKQKASTLTPKTSRAEQARAKQQAAMVLRVKGIAYEDWLVEQHRACFDAGFDALAELVEQTQAGEDDKARETTKKGDGRDEGDTGHVEDHDAR
ncbi:hypothetical protein EXIGUO8H_360007 [Exiguobacterium sp. 8H]|uniref:hypothetical protein n=1 Tax=Exiguobacterium sp. 8H TaxID=2653140 RepID=UPI0012F2AB7B|nr:hypothetical protein [Exiguobacterium sp. 8H]VXB83375.1 hypothetical protein EXIGUO8H_360007 [Exiguobacterium sp. 8H]